MNCISVDLMEGILNRNDSVTADYHLRFRCVAGVAVEVLIIALSIVNSQALSDSEQLLMAAVKQSSMHCSIVDLWLASISSKG
jgi:hypothetical protein